MTWERERNKKTQGVWREGSCCSSFSLNSVSVGTLIRGSYGKGQGKAKGFFVLFFGGVAKVRARQTGLLQVL